MSKISNSISAIIPVYNEEKSLFYLYQRLTKVLRKNFSDWEIIFVTNGCSDDSVKICRQLSRRKKTKFFDLKKPSKSLALNLGFQKAKKKHIATLDADLQDRPEEIPRLFSKLKKDSLDVVIGWRKKRQDSWSKKALSSVFNFVISKTSGLDLHDFNSGLKLMKVEAVEQVKLYGEMHRFLPVMIDNLGFKVGELAVGHSSRKYGQSKYSFTRGKAFFDFLTVLFLSKYTQSPLRFFGLLGLFFGLAGFLINIYLTVLWLQGEAIGHRPLLMLGVLLMVLGMQFFSIGLVGELLVSIYLKEKN